MDEAPLVEAPVVEAPLVEDADRNRVVRVRGLEKGYKRSPALRGLDFDVRRGEMFGLIGPDGAGKSSVIKTVAGVLTYDRGTIEVFGQHVHSERSAERIKGRIGLMPQGLGNNLYAELSVEENIDYFAGLRLVPRDKREAGKRKLLEMTRLDAFRGRLMKQLSGGMKQKLGLVCTLIHEPELVLLDEPTTGVDPVSRRDFWAILSELVHELEMTAIVSTAYMDEAAYLHRLVLLMDGEIVSQGTDDDIRALVQGTVVSFRCRSQLAAIDRLRGHFPLVEGLGQHVRVFVPLADRQQAVQQLLRYMTELAPQEVTAEPPDLEEVLAFMLRREALQAGTTTGREGANIPGVPEQGAGRPRRGGAGPLRQPLDSGGKRTGPSDREPAILAAELVRKFGEFRAVDGVSFEVMPGEIFGLLGANGAGKTTVIKMLTGLLPATEGQGRVAGVNMATASGAIRERIGYMSQSFSLYLDMTVLENIQFYAGVYGLFSRRARERLPWILELTGLEAHRRRMTSDLPMGLRQRLALGCALVHDPQVVFLDEPTSGVDVLGRRRFWQILLRLAREQGVAVLVTTHYMSEAEHCDTLALMYAGRIVAEGPPQRLRDDLEATAGRPLAIETSEPLTAMRLARRNGYPRAAMFGRNLHVLSRDHAEDEQRLARLFDQAGIERLRAESQEITMEDVFVQCILDQESDS